MTLLGSTWQAKRRALGLLATLAIVWPFVVVGELWNLMGRPGCRRSTP